MIFLNSVSSAAALVFYLPGVCTHTDTKGKQSTEYSKIFGKNTIFNKHPVVDAKLPLFVRGNFSCIESPNLEKIIGQFWNFPFSNYPSKIIECSCRKLGWQNNFDNSWIEAELTNRKVFTRFEGIWIELRQKQKVVVFWPKVVVQNPRTHPPQFVLRITKNYHFFDVAPNKSFFVLPVGF